MSWSEIKKKKEEEEKKKKSSNTSDSTLKQISNTLTGSLWKDIGQNIITSQRNAEIRKQKEQEFKKKLNINQNIPISPKTSSNTKREIKPSVTQSYANNYKNATNNSTWNQIKNIANNKNIMTLANKEEMKNATELTSADIDAITEANSFNNTMKNGTTQEKVNAIIGHFGNSIIGGAKQTVGGVGNVGTTLGARVVKSVRNMAKFSKNEELAEKLDSAYDKIVDKGREINDRATYFNKVNSRIDNNAVKTVTGATNTVANVATNAFLTAGTGGGTVLQGLQVGGSSAQEVLNENKDNIGKATTTGIAKGITSYLTEKMFDANILTKGAKKSSIQKLVNDTIENKIKSQLGRNIADKATGIIGENLEEIVEDNVGNLIDRIVNNKKLPEWKEWLNNTSETIKATTLSTAILNLVGLGGDNNQDIEADLRKQNASEKDIQKAKEFVQAVTQENIQSQNTANKDINQEIKTSQNGFSQVEKTEALRQEARNKLESIKQNYDENSYNQMQQFIETAPSEKALNQVISDLNKEAETKQVAPLKQKQEVQLPMKQKPQNKSFEDVAFEAMSSYESNEVESPLKNRDMDSIGKQTKVNAYQYDNPQVKPYFQEMAQQMGEDLAYIASPENRSTKKGGGTKLSTSTKAMDILHNEQGYSYDQIAKGLQNIIDDKGSENNAISKKIELVIDEQLRNGYTNALGKYVKPSQEYINTIQRVKQVQLPMKQKQEVSLPLNENVLNNQNTFQEQYSLAETQPQNNFKYQQSDNAKVDAFRQDASRYWDNSNKTIKLVNTIEKVINDKGYNIRLDNTLGDNVNGKIVTNSNGEIEITLNPNSSRTGEFILGHELTHAIETQEMVDLVKSRIEKDGNLKNAVEDLKKLYKTDEINAEVLADISGQLFGNQEFINNLSMEKPSIFKRIYDKIISLANKITGNSSEALFLKDLKNKWEKAYRENTNNIKETQYSKNNNIPSDISIKDSQGREIDHNIHTYSTDAYEGQVNMRKEFQDEDGNTIAKIDYNYFDGEINVDLIETEPEYRRKGLATRLIQDLKQDAKEEGAKINYGYTSKEGTSLLDSIEKKDKKVYNIINKSITNSERNQVSSEVLTWRNNQEDGIGYIDLSAKGYKSYIYNKQGNNIETLLKVNGNEDFKNYIRKGIEDGTYKKSENINGWATNAKLEYRNNSNDNDVLSNRRNSKGNGGIYDTTNGQQTRNNGTKTIEQNSGNESIENSEKGSFNLSENHKQKQNEIIQKNNPMNKELGEHTWINSAEDIKTYQEAIEEFGGVEDLTPDFTAKDVKKALDTGEVTVYSSYPIEQGTFVTPSKMEAQNYAGNNQVYSKNVKLADVAWIDELQGQYAQVSQNITTQDNQGRQLSKQQQEYFKDSKAVNEKGELETVYHGTNKAGFTEFNRNVNYYTNNKAMAQSYTGGTEMVDTKRLESVSDAKSWLKGITEEFYIENNSVYDYDGEKILNYENKEDLVKNLKRDIQKEIGDTNAGGTYEGYVNITKPIEIDANNEIWSMIDVNNISIEGIDNIEQFLKEQGSSVWREKGKLRTSTADIVSAIYDAVEDGTIDADGVIIKNIFDEGGYGNVTPTESGTDYITFNSNQFKAKDNPNPTSDADIRYSKQNGKWQDYLESHFKSEGTTTDLRDIRLPMKEKQEVKAPISQEVKQQVQEKNNNTKGETINWNEIERPEDNQKFRKHYKSIIESSNTTAEAKAIAKELMGTDTYEPETNKGQLAQADQRIMTSSPETELQSLLSRAMNGEKITSVDIAVGERLIQYFSKTGNKQQLQEAIQATAMAGTSAGQTVQALSMLNHQTPQGQATWIQRSVDKMNKELAKKKGGTIITDADGNLQVINKQGVDITDKVDLFNLTPEMIDKIMNSENQEQMYKNIDEVYGELGQQVPKGMLEKIDSWRYFSMLANARTHIRNMVGNLAMGKTQRLKDKLAGGIEDVVSKFNPKMERTKTLAFADKKTKDFAKQDFKNMEVQSRLELNENKYNPQSRLQNARRTFKSNAMENTLGRLFNLNDKLLSAEDGIGLKAGYQKALADYITANKIDVDNITDAQLNKARNYAVQQAKEATFHQANAIASAVAQFENKNLATKLFTGAVLPFKKTPMNVAKAGMEYSPLQIAKSATVDLVNLRKGNISVNQYIDNLSKGMTGTGIALVGYALANAGILKASGGDDKDKEKYEEEQGKQSYSIQIAGKTYSLDWLAPTGIPLFIGAETHKLFNQEETEKSTEKKSEEDRLNQAIKGASNLLNAGATAINPMSEMSMISGLTSALSSYNTSDNLGSLGNIMTNAGKSYVNQFFPTLMGQVAKTTDKYERTTKSTATGTIGKAVDQTINQIKNKIPGLRQTLPIKTDIWGKELKQEVNLPLRAINNFVNPATVKNVSTDKVDMELNKLYEENHNSSLLPDILTKTVQLNKQTYRLSNKEYAEFTKNYGQTSHKLIENFIKTSDYNKLTQEQKETAISNIYSYAKEQNKLDYAKKVNETVKPSTLYTTMKAIEKGGGKQSEYLNYLAKTKGMSKESEKNKVLADSNYSNKTKEIIYTNGTGKDDNLYNDLLSKSNINMTEYLDYKDKVSNKSFSADKDKNGKTITGSAKKKVINYLNNNITGFGNRLLIAGNSYALQNSEKQKLAEYINSTVSTREERLEIYKQLDKNFTIKDGKVYMRVSR